MKGPFCWFSSSAKIFLAIFFLSLTTGGLVQGLGPKFLPGWHLGHGLFIGDAATTHEFALRLLGQGPRALPSSPEPSLYIWLTAATYRIFRPEPWVMLPWQALAQALAGLGFFQMLRAAGIGLRGGWAGALWLAVHPQNLEWAAQLQKDGFFLAGNVLLLWGLFSRTFRPGLVRGLAGLVLIFLCRPPFLPVVAAQLLVLAVAACLRIRGGPLIPIHKGTLVVLLLCAFAINQARNWAPGSVAHVVQGHDYSQSLRHAASSSEDPRASRFRSSWLQGVPGLEGWSRQIHYLRSVTIREGGRSLLDQEVTLGSLAEQIRYVPRALWIALAAPLPGKLNDWWKPSRLPSEETKAFRMHPSGELTGGVRRVMPWCMLVSLVVLAGIGFGFARGETRGFCLGLLVFSVPVLILLAEITPNLGTLVRLRFPYWAPLTGLGLACWIQVWAQLSEIKK